MTPFGIVGWSGSGKTTLMAALIPALRAKGFSVSTIKHTHHDIDLDKPGKDSYVHRHAGASESVLAGPKRWTLIHEDKSKLDDLLRAMAPVDLVLIEGFKTDPIPRMEVFRPSLGKDRISSDVVAVASDEDIPDLSVPRLDLNDVPAIADFIQGFVK